MCRRSIIFFVFFLMTCTCAQAQINIKVGFGVGYTPAGSINGIFKQYNSSLEADENIDVETLIPELHFMNGVVVGFRWRTDYIGLDFNWENLSRKRKGFSENEMTGAFLDDEYSFSSNNLSVGLESYYGRIGVGTSIGYRRFKIKTPFEGTDNDDTLIRDHQYNVGAYLLINLSGSDALNLIMKPYINIPLNGINLVPSDNEFVNSFNDRDTVPRVTVDPNESERLWIYGLSFIFYNGYQGR